MRLPAASYEETKHGGVVSGLLSYSWDTLAGDRAEVTVRNEQVEITTPDGTEPLFLPGRMTGSLMVNRTRYWWLTEHELDTLQEKQPVVETGFAITTTPTPNDGFHVLTKMSLDDWAASVTRRQPDYNDPE